jgi:NAD(P)H dehydrogenase (quinone)
MNILIVYAQPELKSFGHAMLECASMTLKNKGHAVKISDLYEIKWNPVGGPADFKDRIDTQYFNYLLEQQYASKHNFFIGDIKEEMEKVLWADLIIFQTPIWWFSAPAILKGWFDRVFATGFAWDFGAIYDKGLLRGKKAMLSVTTGGPQMLYAKDAPHRATIDEILHPITHGTFHFCGMDVLPTFVAWSTYGEGEEGRKKYLEEYKKRLVAIDSTAPMPDRPISEI